MSSLGKIIQGDMLLRLRSARISDQEQKNYRIIVENIFYGILVLVCVYLFIGVVSLAEVSEGADIQYSEFWHGPWRILFSYILN